MKIVTFLAQALQVGSGKGQVNNLPTISAGSALANGLYIVYWVGGVIAVIAIIFAGFTYVTSSGNAAAVTKAKNIMLYSVIGLVVIALAFVVTQFIIGSFAK